MTNPVEKEVKRIVGIILKFCINNSENTSFIIGNSKNQMGMLMAFRSQIYLINCHSFWHCFILFFSYLQENWILTRFFFFEIDIYIIQKQNKMITSSFPLPPNLSTPGSFFRIPTKILHFQSESWLQGLILAAWNQRSPITSYWLNSAQKFNICLSSKTGNCDQGYICNIMELFRHSKI